MLYAGSMVFLKPRRRVDLSACTWWQFVRGADVRHPLGPESSIEGLERHPAVHVAYRDVEAYAKWAGKELPTEAEWEFAARGGLDGADYAWGDELYRDGRHMANTWQGEFPWQNLRSDGYERTSPVDAFPPNGYGLYDMIGNVWEWTTDWYHPRHTAEPQKACCIPQQSSWRPPSKPATTPRSPRSKFPAKCSKAAPTCVRRTIAAATGPPPVTRTPSTPPPVTSASAASCGRSVEASCPGRERPNRAADPQGAWSTASPTTNSTKRSRPSCPQAKHIGRR